MSKLGKQLGEIGSGWFNYYFESPEVETIALPRLKICDSCPHRKDNRCGICGCYLVAKTRSINSSCPDKRW